MGGLLAGLVFSYFLSFSTMFLLFYAAAVKFKLGQKLPDLFRLVAAGFLAVLFMSPFVTFIMVKTLAAICIAFVVHVLLARYLTTISFETLSKPRNILLRIKHSIAPNVSPVIFSIAITAFGIIGSLFAIATLFFTD